MSWPQESAPAYFAGILKRRGQGRQDSVPRFEKVEREEPADGVVIEGDDL